MFKLSKKFVFEAAHHLPRHDGKCQRVHGHSWVGWITVEASQLIKDGPETGMVMDYADLKAIMKPIVEEYLDHHDLNETTGLENPTSEALAKWIFSMVYSQWYAKAPAGVRLVSITIEETCTSRCTYEV